MTQGELNFNNDKPLRGQKRELLELLILGWMFNEEGWVHFRRLNNVCFRYGARIFELRRLYGENFIEEKRTEGNVWHYRINPEHLQLAKGLL